MVATAGWDCGYPIPAIPGSDLSPSEAARDPTTGTGAEAEMTWEDEARKGAEENPNASAGAALEHAKMSPKASATSALRTTPSNALARVTNERADDGVGDGGPRWTARSRLVKSPLASRVDAAETWTAPRDAPRVGRYFRKTLEAVLGWLVTREETAKRVLVLARVAGVAGRAKERVVHDMLQETRVSARGAYGDGHRNTLLVRAPLLNIATRIREKGAKGRIGETLVAGIRKSTSDEHASSGGHKNL
jgi:hypothetical protein